MSNNFNPAEPVVYQIRIKGRLDAQWTDWFGGMTVEPADGGDTLLTGAVDPHSVFARWLFLGESIRFLASLPERSAAQDASLSILRSLDTGDEQLVIMADREGNPEIRGWGDARDVADGCLRVLEPKAADGEAFNLGGVAPFAADGLVKHIAARLNLPCVTARLPTARAPWYVSSAKARALLGYHPRYSVFDMVDEGAAKLTGG